MIFRTYGLLQALSVGLFSAVDVLFLQWAGQSWVQIGLLTAVFNVAVSVCELPTAVVADLRSPRAALLAGLAVRAASLLLFALGTTTGVFAAAEALAGLGLALTSGAFDAVFVASLQDRDSQTISHAYAALSKAGSLGQLVGVVGGVVCFALAPRAVWALACAAMLVALVVATRFPAPAPTPAQRAPQARQVLSVLGALATRPVFWLAVVAASSGIAPYLLWQQLIGSTALTVLAVTGAAMAAAGTLGAHLAQRLHASTRLMLAVLVVNAALTLALPLWDQPVVRAAVFLVHVAAQTVVGVWVYGLFQSSVQDSWRATSTSASSMADSLVSAVGAVGVGALMNAAGPGAAMLVSVGLYALTGVLALVTARQQA